MKARCPFCGSDDVKLLEHYPFVDPRFGILYSCKCRGCDASGPVCEDSLEAERKWADMPYLSGRISEAPLYEEGVYTFIRTSGESVIRNARG